MSERQGFIVVQSSQKEKEVLEAVFRLWEEGVLPPEYFPNGFSKNNIVRIDKMPRRKSTPATPLEQDAQALVNLLMKTAELEELREEAETLIPVIEAVLDKHSLTGEQREAAKDKKNHQLIISIVSGFAELESIRNSAGDLSSILGVIKGDLSEKAIFTVQEAMTTEENGSLVKGKKNTSVS
ncbi:hypothetical protein [Oscillatoria salina]|uniref:hypothetical protein n=1 Tax=Oscillatoria salina TaxID=331517 RepID=UPI0013B7B49D|nr:hypothetical protein [Oscillatoria salina]MBZ8179146.1 hypothetical protein [Oscillatoria salina IIICB1]NET88069.1 hypothetical protein [Kamptonema sp. SIO1D9]